MITITVTDPSPELLSAISLGVQALVNSHDIPAAADWTPAEYLEYRMLHDIVQPLLEHESRLFWEPQRRRLESSPLNRAEIISGIDGIISREEPNGQSRTQ